MSTLCGVFLWRRGPPHTAELARLVDDGFIAIDGLDPDQPSPAAKSEKSRHASYALVASVINLPGAGDTEFDRCDMLLGRSPPARRAFRH